MGVTDELLRNAEQYAADFDRGDLPLPPGKRVVVLACMDARLNPYGLLGLSEGDAHVIRNAGGPPRRSTTSSRTSASRSPGSRRAPSSRERSRFAASSTT